jgi:hypothetical protein
MPLRSWSRTDAPGTGAHLCSIFWYPWPAAACLRGLSISGWGATCLEQWNWAAGSVCLLVCTIAKGNGTFWKSLVTFLTFPDTSVVLQLICQLGLLKECQEQPGKKGTALILDFWGLQLQCPFKTDSFFFRSLLHTDIKAGLRVH